MNQQKVKELHDLFNRRDTLINQINKVTEESNETLLCSLHLSIKVVVEISRDDMLNYLNNELANTELRIKEAGGTF